MDKQTVNEPASSTLKPKKNLKALFSSLVTREDTATHDNTRQPLTPTKENADNWQNRREGETYYNYGTRICAKVTASKYSFPAFLQKIYNVEKQSQINNSELQQQYKNNIQQDIAGIDDTINQNQGQINRLEISRHNLTEQVATCQAELDELREHNGQENKNEKVKLVIGGVILILLTFYLFMFYSSTFYSAFFKNFMEASTSIGVHMFDAQAIPASLSAGIGQLAFVLSAPIIFMGLGFALHYFTKEKGLQKYLKISAIIIVTFIFDCILAYSIAKNIYEVIIMSSLEQMPEYSLQIAVKDHNVWAVIFCGFVVYILWGIVFSLTMTAYEELKSNKGEQIRVLGKIANLKSQITANKTQESNIRTRMASLEVRKQVLMQKLNNNHIIDNSSIKVAMNDFYAGWMSMMAALGCSSDEQDIAQQIYQQNIQTLLATDTSDSTETIK